MNLTALAKVIATGLVASALCVGAATAATVQVTYNSVVYDVTTYSGSFDSNSALLESQVWWGDAAAAQDFAALVGSALGYPNDCFYQDYCGPDFAYQLVQDPSPPNYTIGYVFRQSDQSVVAWHPATVSTARTYAIATLAPVPLPAGGVLMVTALAGLAGLRRRKRQTARQA